VMVSDGSMMVILTPLSGVLVFSVRGIGHCVRGLVFSVRGDTVSVVTL